ncbi:MAG TPA: hypothetical protein VMU81_04030 [Acetobacteraceae bacterium]|nr:hypothetical protein [Acetobacteraceae bacterium]
MTVVRRIGWLAAKHGTHAGEGGRADPLDGMFGFQPADDDDGHLRMLCQFGLVETQKGAGSADLGWGDDHDRNVPPRTIPFGRARSVRP